MTEFPKTRREMERFCYTFKNVGTCRGCGAAIEWWETMRRRKIPMNPMANDDSAAVAYFATCPKASEFRAESEERKHSRLEPDDNACIALSVLRDAGRSIERIGLEIAVSLTRTAYTLPGAQPDEDAVAARALEASRLIVAKLLRRKLDARRGNAWLLAGAVASVCASLNLARLGDWCPPLVGLCVLFISAVRHRRAKGGGA